MPSPIQMKTLLEAGVHFGHQTRRWNPKMKQFIFTERNGIHIIDLQQTVKKLEDAMTYVRELSAGGGTLLFVGTKKQAQETIEEEAGRCGMPYVNRRWLGGMLTNFITIEKRIRRLEELEQRKAMGDFDRLPKKEASRLDDELERLLRLLGGMRGRYRLPDAVFIVDPHREEIAVAESRRAEIPIVAMVDTNCNPDVIDHPIPSNDDAIRAIRLLVGKIADSVIEGRQQHESAQADVDGAVDGEADGDAAEKMAGLDIGELPREWSGESGEAAGGEATEPGATAAAVEAATPDAETAEIATEPPGESSGTAAVAEEAAAPRRTRATARRTTDAAAAGSDEVATEPEDVTAHVNAESESGTELPAGTVTANVPPEDQEPTAGAEDRATSARGA